MEQPILDSNLQSFINQLIDERKYENLDPKLREQIFYNLYDKLSIYLITVITKYLDEEDVKKLQAIENSKNISAQKVQQLLIEKMPYAKEVIAKAMLEFRAIYLNS